MVNVAVFNLKDVLKFLFKFAVIVSIIMFLLKSYKILNQISFTKAIDKTIPAIAYINNEDDIEHKIKELKKDIWVKHILDSQLAMKNSIVKKETEKDEIINNVENADDNIIEEVQKNVETQVVDENNIASTYTNSYKSVEVKNSSKYDLTEDILKPDIQISNKKDIVIYHTHTCESYTPTEKFPYEMMGSYRTIDLNYSVSRVGDELEKYLIDKRIQCYTR